MHMPGYGDAATWPASISHPNDPRRDDGADVSIGIAVNQLAEEMAADPVRVGDALTCISDSAWDEIGAAIARQDAAALLAACRRAILPELIDMATARLLTTPG